MTSIHIDGLAITYGDNTVISDLDLTIENGEFFTLLGPSGCGKTTLLRSIAGFIAPARGRISFGDRDVTGIPTHRRNIGMMFQDYALFPHLTVKANVAYGLKARRVPRREVPGRVAEALERVGMAGFADRHPGALSGGQRQRVALARALVIRPSVLLMDEPLSALDTKLRLQIRESIADLQRELGITTVFVTHDQEEALALSDRIALFRSGTIEQLGSPTEIYRSPVSSYAADFIGAANVLPVSVSQDAVHATGEHVAVMLGGTELRGVRRTELAAGEAFAIARPEHLRLAVEGGSHDATVTPIAGEVIRQQYLGHRQQHRVRLADGSVIETSEPASAPGFAGGDRVTVLFPVQNTLVMAS
ncbi:ABC transporter ATP-binding protein [Microbacterium capsulatum]|uniref:ABC transporter ATP-binding protein n=1 Tax=Microbacterium capsulatum TaxID=3041921 RepID=A0ABU0XDN6_9MICO|nr:ABC transporter ATP-binding protein [Microbacterium sp. ASV81]MDQ4213234.1 ABC transporter ATP-binding protein [Microbacterium sp. ASV81]